MLAGAEQMNLHLVDARAQDSGNLQIAEAGEFAKGYAFPLRFGKLRQRMQDPPQDLITQEQLFRTLGIRYCETASVLRALPKGLDRQVSGNPHQPCFRAVDRSRLKAVAQQPGERFLSDFLSGGGIPRERQRVTVNAIELIFVELSEFFGVHCRRLVDEHNTLLLTQIVSMPVKLLAFIGNASAQKSTGYEQKEIAEAFPITTT